MSDAPERIWVQREFHEACVRGSACIHETARHAIGYIREDVHAAALVAKDAEIARLRVAMTEIIAATDNSGIEYASVGMRVAERVEDIARAALNTQHEGETP